jgi:hypothetical protein
LSPGRTSISLSPLIFWPQLKPLISIPIYYLLYSTINCGGGVWLPGKLFKIYTLWSIVCFFLLSSFLFLHIESSFSTAPHLWVKLFKCILLLLLTGYGSTVTHIATLVLVIHWHPGWFSVDQQIPYTVFSNLICTQFLAIS